MALPQSIRDIIRQTGLDDVSSAFDSYQPTLSDTADLAVPIRALRANAAGVVACYTAASANEAGGGTVRLLNFAAGETRCVVITRLLATGTTIAANQLEAMP